MTATAQRRSTRKTRTGGIESNVGDLLDVLNIVGNAVGDGRTNPVTQNVLMRDGKMTCTNGEWQIDAPCNCDATTLVNHARLVAILKVCPRDSTVTLTPGETSCVVECGSSSWTLPCQSPDEFPVWPVGTLKVLPRMPADQFKRMAEAVSSAADKESARYALDGVCIDVAGGVVSFVATDGRRLSKAEAELSQDLDETQTLVPSKAFSIMAKLAVGAGEVQLESSTNEVVCQIEGGPTVTARLLDGGFPNWRKAIPDRPDAKSSVVDREKLKCAVRAARICSDETSRGVTFAFSEKGLWLHSQSATAGEASITCDIDQVGHEVSVHMDPTYVLQWLDKLPADGDPVIEVEAVDNLSAVVFRNDDYLGLVMPMDKGST